MMLKNGHYLILCLSFLAWPGQLRTEADVVPAQPVKVRLPPAQPRTGAGEHPGAYSAPGIDFMVSGNEPFWSLAIDFSQSMQFTAVGEDTLTTPVPLPHRQQPDGTIVYLAGSKAGPLQVRVQPLPCVDDMSGLRTDYSVEVRANGRTYRGCGRYLFDVTRLQGTWTLTALHGEMYAPEASPENTPVLEMQVLDQRLTGTTGCSSLMGWVVVESDKISFTNLTVARHLCPDTDTESRFLDALAQVNCYRLTAENLVLLKDDQEILRFSKAE
jgi:heat shock protein HslJ